MRYRKDRIIVHSPTRTYSMSREEGDLATPLLKLAGLAAVALLLAGGYYAVLVIAGLVGLLLLASGQLLDALAAWWAGLAELGRLTWEALLALAMVAGSVGLLWLALHSYLG